MRKATLIRLPSIDAGTFGTITTDSGFTCRSGELPWKKNVHDSSCIPVGIYTVVWALSPSKGMCYHVQDVPGRTSILIHSANYMGDVTKTNPSTSFPYVAQLLGCISPGLDVAELANQQAVISSKTALARLEADLNYESFELTITEEES